MRNTLWTLAILVCGFAWIGMGGLPARTLADKPPAVPNALSDEQPSEDQILFKDNFDGELADGWSWVREAPDQWRIRNGALELRTQAGQIWGGSNKTRNILLRRPPQTPHTAVAAAVTVSNDPKLRYEQAGLLWYYNDDHFVKLVKEHIDGKPWIVMGCAPNGKHRVAAKVRLPSSRVRLRLKVQGEQVTGYWRKVNAEGKPVGKWHKAASCRLKDIGEGRFGLFTQNGPKKVKRWSRFDRFRIFRVGGKSAEK